LGGLFVGLKESIKTRGAIVGVIGLGYVGLPLAMAAGEAGFQVVGLEKDGVKRDKLAAGDALYEGLDGIVLASLLARGKFRVTGDADELSSCDIICICVPTPLSKTRDPDLGLVRYAAAQANIALNEGKRPKLIVIESTSYPGTTREFVKPLLEKGGMELGRDFYLAYSPERVDPGNEKWNIYNTPKLVGGITDECTELAEAFYGFILEKAIKVSSPEIAEMAKILENIFRGVNIALVNEMWMLCNRMGLDVWEVIEAAATKPFGFMSFWPGPGLGGHCIPVDPFYLAWKAREYDFHTEFIELAGKINVRMPFFVANLVQRELNQAGKTQNGSRVLILGVAYKPDVGDTRETPAAKLMELLLERGADIAYHDPYVPEFKVGDVVMRSVDLDEETVIKCDCVVVVTAHNGIDYDMVASSGVPVLDTRNVLPKEKPGATSPRGIGNITIGSG
jgi:UDP-N-acetyl-D-glucosamine dehydrogenase